MPDVVVISTKDLMRIIHTLRSIDRVDGFDNMDRLVGVVSALEEAINGAYIKDQKSSVEE